MLNELGGSSRNWLNVFANSGLPVVVNVVGKECRTLIRHWRAAMARRDVRW
uniref:Uncharacterized protein n=1 Tax=Hyaloperonospora arabidopsidis (strain Emoy2) TaxID=559515 RepID=M4C1D3_HYAAE